MTCDSLVATDVVLADGRVVTADATQHPDLFWALRGGAGGNFGVNVSFTFRVHEPPPALTVVTARWDSPRRVEILDALLDLQIAGGGNPALRSKTVLTRAVEHPRDDDLAVETLGLYRGSPAEARDALAPAFAVAKPESSSFRSVTYAQATRAFATWSPRGRFESRNAFEGERMSVEGLEVADRWFRRWPGGRIVPRNLGLHFPVGGAVRAVDPAATAFVHRGSNFLYQSEAVWHSADDRASVAEMLRWLRESWAAVAPHLESTAYQNFPDRAITDWATAYYAGNYPRLQQVKAAYDPTSVFRYSQAIVPA